MKKITYVFRSFLMFFAVVAFAQAQETEAVKEGGHTNQRVNLDNSTKSFLRQIHTDLLQERQVLIIISNKQIIKWILPWTTRMQKSMEKRPLLIPIILQMF